MFERAGIAHTGRWGQQKQIKRSSFLSDSRVVNHRGVVRTRAVCRGLWVSKLGRHPPPGHPLIHCGRRPHLFTTNIRQAVWATCHRAFNCLFLSPPSNLLSSTHTHLFLSCCFSPCPPHLSSLSLSPLPPYFHSFLSCFHQVSLRFVPSNIFFRSIISLISVFKHIVFNCGVCLLSHIHTHTHTYFSSVYRSNT